MGRMFEVSAPTEGIISCERDAELFLNRESLGKGDFFVTERDVVFVGGQNLRLLYNTISVHAISKDSANFPNRHCIFMLVNDQDVEHVDEPEVSEYHLVPLEHNLDSLYNALCEGQSLNPDEDMYDSTAGGATGLGGRVRTGITHGTWARW